MLEEILQIKLRNNTGKIVDSKLYLYEEAPNNKEYVKLELNYNDETFESSAENYFDALINLREKLEKKSIQILCRGANKNVYPSAMQLNMGTGRNAYMLTMHKQARQQDVVDIFEFSKIDECVSVLEQSEFFNLWAESLEG
jgi:hypothetical protein